MIKWHIKYSLAAILGLLPFRHYLHQKAQKLLGGAKLDEEEMLSRAIELYSLISKFRMRIEDNNVLEIGTGWFPYMPIVAYLYGAKNITTVDLNPWLTNRTLRQTMRSVLDNQQQLVANTKLEYKDIEKKLSNLEDIYAENSSFDNTLSKLHINYLPNYDVCDLSFDEEKKIDLILSSNVLEHINENVLKKIHKHLLIVSTNSVIAVHRYNPADHYAHLSGSSISFLTIPELLWRVYRQGGIAYHNRLRTIEHAAIVKNAGWGIKFWADAIDNKIALKVKNEEIKLNTKYKKMSVDEVCAFYSWFVLSKETYPQEDIPRIVSWVSEII